MNQNVTNASIFSIDWSAADRQKFLKSIPKGKAQEDRALAPGLMAKGILGRDVSMTDPRSVKAMLRGTGDGRSTWWRIFDAALAAVAGNAILGSRLQAFRSVEGRMYAFHKLHHAMTFCRLGLQQDFYRQKAMLEKLAHVK